jgi:hypothetical protein
VCGPHGTGGIEASALLDRQDGPVFALAADHFFPMTATSQRWGDLYAWQLDRASRTPLSRQIYMQVWSAAY